MRKEQSVFPSKKDIGQILENKKGGDVSNQKFAEQLVADISSRQSLEEINRLVKQKTEEFNIQAKKRESINKGEKDEFLKDSGVPALFEGLRDSGFLKWSDQAPARITDGNNEISIFFNAAPYCSNSRITIGVIYDAENSLALGLIKKEEIIKIERGNLEEILATEIFESNLATKELFRKYEDEKAHDGW